MCWRQQVAWYGDVYRVPPKMKRSSEMSSDEWKQAKAVHHKCHSEECKWSYLYRSRSRCRMLTKVSSSVGVFGVDGWSPHVGPWTSLPGTTCRVFWAQPWHRPRAGKGPFHAPDPSLWKWKSELIPTQPDSTGANGNPKPPHTPSAGDALLPSRFDTPSCREAPWSWSPHRQSPAAVNQTYKNALQLYREKCVWSRRSQANKTSSIQFLFCREIQQASDIHNDLADVASKPGSFLTEGEAFI